LSLVALWHYPLNAKDKGRQDILVWDIMPTAGVSMDTADLLTSLLAAELSKTGRNVTTKHDVEQALSIQQERQRCGDDVSCMAEIGNALGSRDAVVGTIGRLGETWVLTLQRIDVRKVQVQKRVACSMTGAVDTLIPHLAPMATRLFPTELNAAQDIAEAIHGIAEIVTTPPGATLTIDGMDTATAPTARNLAPGTHTILATAPDHTAVEKQITISADNSTRVHLTLPPTHGYASVSLTPPGATLTIDESAVTLDAQPIRLPVGTHRIAATLKGYVSHNQTITVTGPPVQKYTIRLKKPGILKVTAIPANATVVLDGKPAGNASDAGRADCSGHRN